MTRMISFVAREYQTRLDPPVRHASQPGKADVLKREGAREVLLQILRPVFRFYTLVFSSFPNLEKSLKMGLVEVANDV
jgi:hypothetical protein